jgi:hypothetical protein
MSMAERAIRVATKPPQMPAEGTVQLVSHDNGVRWVVKLKLGYKLEAARQSEWATKSAADSDMPDTEYAFVGDTEEDAFAAAKEWLGERYQIK